MQEQLQVACTADVALHTVHQSMIKGMQEEQQTWLAGAAGARGGDLNTASGGTATAAQQARCARRAQKSGARGVQVGSGQGASGSTPHRPDCSCAGRTKSCCNHASRCDENETINSAVARTE